MLLAARGRGDPLVDAHFQPASSQTYDDRMITRREAIAALSSAAALPLVSGCKGDGPPSSSSTAPATTEADALALLDEVAENLLRLHPRARRRSASTPARERRFDRSSPIARRQGSSGSRTSFAPTWSASTPSTRPASRMPRAPASRSCAAPTRRRSRGSRCPTATSPSAAGATRRTSSSRTSARISTSRASSTAIIASRTPPTPRRISRGCSRMRSSSTASSAACRRRARRAWCRRRS